mgnify:CR=1 FL=1
MHDMMKGVSELAAVLHRRMNRETEAVAATVLDFGSIDEGWNLTTNLFPVKLPRSEYQICRSLALGKEGEELAPVENDEAPETASGKIKVPARMRSLKPGDRVLVAWVGCEAVVVDIILPATEAG